MPEQVLMGSEGQSCKSFEWSGIASLFRNPCACVYAARLCCILFSIVLFVLCVLLVCVCVSLFY